MPLFEVHVTIDPVFEDDPKREILERIATNHNFKLAKLYMLKDSFVPEQESDRDTFMTYHSRDYGLAVHSTKVIVDHLRRENFKVRRYKIEEIVMDSKVVDLLGILE